MLFAGNRSHLTPFFVSAIVLPHSILYFGCFPFTKRFRKFRLGCKWNMIFRFVPPENFRKSETSEKVVPFSRWKFSDGTACSIYGFRKGLPVPGRSRPYLRQGNMAATPSASSVASVPSAFYECSVCHGLAPDLGTYELFLWLVLLGTELQRSLESS